MDYEAQDKHPPDLQTECPALKNMKFIFIFFSDHVVFVGPDSESRYTVDSERLVYKYIFNNFLF